MALTTLITDAAISAAKGISKVVLGKLVASVKGENRGTIIPYRSEGSENIICFVHGFCGDPGSTFSPLPQFIIDENELKGWDILSIGYSTDMMPNIGSGLWAATPDITKVAGYLETNLDIIMGDYKRVALIGHSMGGLVIQRAILNLPDIHRISHVLLYGTPSAGLKKAWFLRWFKNQIADMDDTGTFITTLRRDWDAKFQKEEDYPFRFAAIAGELDEFVPVHSSIEPFPEQYRRHTSGNHVSMVKPERTTDTSFQIIKKVLCADRNEDYLVGFDQKELNNQIAKYYEDAHNLSKNFNDLDKDGLKKYIFALEGTGKIDTAIRLIEASEVLQTNTDFMGILGGRWKRKYLTTSSAASLKNAIEWYEKGLTLSLAAGNHGQVFYHAINLAFMYLMDDDTDTSRTKNKANLAMEHCNKYEGEGYWVLATRAEAFLYLGDFENCKTNYRQAVDKCKGNIREISSMFINAIYAAIRLKREDWKNELAAIFIRSSDEAAK